MRKPNLFIVGEPKCGTTAMHEYLGQHPDIFMCDPKEPAFFVKDFHEESAKYHGKVALFSIRTRKQYLDLFKKAKNEKIIGESSTGYLYSKVAAENIKRFNPNAKIIIMLRNPVDFLYSLHSQYVFNLDEPVTDFKKALALESKRKAGLFLPKRVPQPSRLFYSEIAKFSDQIKRYFKYFGRKQVMIIIFDDFKHNTISVYKDTLAFLGVNQDFKPDFQIINPNKKVRRKKIKLISDYIQINRYFKLIVPDRVYQKLASIYRRHVFIEEPRRPLDIHFRLELMKRFKPEVAKLSRLLNINLIKQWGYNKI